MPCPPSPSSLGSVLVVSSITSPPTGLDLYTGRVVYAADTARFWYYTGTLWQILPFGNVPRFRLSKSGTQSISASTITDITFDTETAPEYDADGLHTGSNATVTIPAGMAGLWTFGYTGSFAATGTGDKEFYLTHSASAERYADTIVNAGAVSVQLTGASDIVIAAGDTVKLTCFQSTAGAVNAQTSCRFWGSFRAAP